MFIRQRDEVREAYDRLAADYDDAYTDAKDIAENLLLARLIRRSYVGKSLLDLGCGTGLLLELVPMDGYLGLDLSPGMLSRARLKFPDAIFREADMEEPWPVVPGTVDSVVSLFGSFNYSLRPGRTVAQLARALRPGGRFLLVLYGTRWPTRHSYVEGSDGTRLLYTAREAQDLFSPTEFKRVRVRGLSRFVDRFRSGPLSLARATLALEVATLLRLAPDQAYFLLVEGQRV